MTGIQRYPDFESAYLEQLFDIYKNPQFINSPRGNKSKETLSVSYCIENPRERLVRCKARKYNLVFNFAEVLWYLAASSELAHMAFYGPLMSKFSADGQRLQGTAYGPRIFFAGPAQVNQWTNVVRTLRADPDSKRALIQIFAAEELIDVSSIDVACTVGLQYFIREGKVHSTGFMRANDAFRGCVSDVFAFTFLHELMACDLGLELGEYAHMVSSYHIYDYDTPRVVAMLEDPSRIDDATPFPKMPSGDNWPHIRAVIAHERALRLAHVSMTAADIERLPLPAYLQHVVCLFAIHAERHHAKRIDREKLALLPACFARSLENLYRAELAR